MGVVIPECVRLLWLLLQAAEYTDGRFKVYRSGECG